MTFDWNGRDVCQRHFNSLALRVGIKRTESPVSPVRDTEIPLPDPILTFVWVSAQTPAPEHFPELEINISISIFAGVMPVVVGPASQNRIEVSDDILGRRLLLALQPLANTSQKTQYLSLFWLNKALAVIVSDVETKEVETIFNGDNSCFRIVQYQAFLLQAVLYFGFKQVEVFLSLGGDNKVVGISNESEFALT